MLIKNCVKNDDDSLNFDFHVDPQEAAFLMDYSIKSLIYNGLLKVEETENEQQMDLFADPEETIQ